MSDATDAYTRRQFKAALRELRMSLTAFAGFVGVSRQTVYGWGRGDRAFPPWVPLLLESWQENHRHHARAAASAELTASTRHQEIRAHVER